MWPLVLPMARRVQVCHSPTALMVATNCGLVRVRLLSGACSCSQIGLVAWCSGACRPLPTARRATVQGFAEPTRLPPARIAYRGALARHSTQNTRRRRKTSPPGATAPAGQLRQPNPVSTRRLVVACSARPGNLALSLSLSLEQAFMMATGPDHTKGRQRPSSARSAMLWGRLAKRCRTPPRPIGSAAVEGVRQASEYGPAYDLAFVASATDAADAIGTVDVVDAVDARDATDAPMTGRWRLTRATCFPRRRALRRHAWRSLATTLAPLLTMSRPGNYSGPHQRERDRSDGPRGPCACDLCAPHGNPWVPERRALRSGFCQVIRISGWVGDGRGACPTEREHCVGAARATNRRWQRRGGPGIFPPLPPLPRPRALPWLSMGGMGMCGIKLRIVSPWAGSCFSSDIMPFSSAEDL